MIIARDTDGLKVKVEVKDLGECPVQSQYNGHRIYFEKGTHLYEITAKGYLKMHVYLKKGQSATVIMVKNPQ